MKDYRLVDYHDVWGNADDGWDVNGISRTEEIITMDDNITNEEIFNYLKDTIGYFGDDCQFEDISFDWYGNGVEMYAMDNDMPLGRLEEEIPYQKQRILTIDTTDLGSMIQLMDCASDYPEAIFGKNEDDEATLMEVYEDRIVMKTLQDNGWLRENFYYRDGSTEELFDK